MDLKRAWRNGFLAPLLLAVPLFDLSLGENNNLIADGNAQKPSVAYAQEGNIGADVADENRLTIPDHVLTSMLLDSGRPSINDGREVVIHFDPQDLLDSAEGSGDGFQELTEDTPLFADARLGSGTPLSIGFVGPTAAAGVNSPHALALFTAGGNSGPGGASGNPTEDTVETLLADPVSEEQSQIAPPDDVEHGTENGAQTVPEPSSLVLLAIGSIAVALLIQRKSSIPTTRS